MAHQTNVTPVMRSFGESGDFPKEVVDPVCGKKLDRKSARHMLFRKDETYYFCSRDCQNNFGKKTKKEAA